MPEICLQPDYGIEEIGFRNLEIEKALSSGEGFLCGPTWARTRDPLIMSQVL